MARITIKKCVPVKARLKYVGIMDNKSIIPKALKIYLNGFGEIHIRVKYSIVNKIVKIHSE